MNLTSNRLLPCRTLSLFVCFVGPLDPLVEKEDPTTGPERILGTGQGDPRALSNLSQESSIPVVPRTPTTTPVLLPLPPSLDLGVRPRLVCGRTSKGDWSIGP